MQVTGASSANMLEVQHVYEKMSKDVQKVDATSAQPTDVSQVLQGDPGQQDRGPPPQNHGTGDRNT